MKFDGYKQVPFAKIIGPGDVKKRQRTEDVKRLVDSIKELGDEPMHAMVARKEAGSWELVAGRDRYSALLLLGAKDAWVHVVKTATPLELIKAEAHENLRRRSDDPAKLIAALDKAEAAILSARSSGKSKGDPAMGRPKTARGEARELIAEATGRTTESVRHTEDRAKSREEGAGRHGAQGDPATPDDVRGHETPAAPPIELHGHAMPERMADVLPLVKQFDKVDRLLRQTQAAVTELGMFGGVPPGVVESFKRALHGVAVHVRSEAPAHLCPKCDGKSVPIAGPFCPLCQEHGWVREDAYRAAPKKGVSVEEHAAGLDAEPTIGEAIANREPPRARKIPPIKAGVTYGVDDSGVVVERDVKPAKATKPKRGPRVVIATASGDHEVTEEEARELTVERDDGNDAWVE